MSGPAGPIDESAGVRDLLAQVHEPAEVDRGLVRMIVERAASRDPPLADVIRLCAVPRRFDARVFEVLRPGDDGENRRLLERLVQHSFVRIGGDGAFMYDDLTRGVLLEEWHAPERAEEFEEVTGSLVEFFIAEHTRAQADELELRRIGDIVRKAKPARYVQLVARIENSLLTPLLEAIYHQGSLSPEAAYDLFEEFCFDYEAKGRLALCQTLVHATQHAVEEGEPSARDWSLRWLRFWEGRLENGLGHYRESEAIMGEVLERAGDDTKLQLWALSELLAAQRDQQRLREAMDTAVRELELAERTQADPLNLSRSWFRLGALHWGLEEHEEAESAFRRGLDVALEDDLAGRALLLCNLARVLSDVGRREEAIAAALEAFDLTRLGLPNDGPAHLRLAETLSQLLVDVDPMAAEAAFREGKEIAREIDDPLQGLGVGRDWVNTLLDAGQVNRAVEYSVQLDTAESGHLDEIFHSSLLLDKASLAESEGQPRRAIELYDLVLQRVGLGLSDLWQHAAALTNRGLQYSELGRWSEAEEDFRAAEQLWRDLRNDIMADVILVNLAGVARRRGDLDEARGLLERARGRLQGGASGRSGFFHRTRAEVLAAAGEWAGAAEDYGRALGVYHATINRSGAASVLADLAALANNQSRWREAAQHAAGAARLWQELADMNAFYPTAEMKIAARENAKGIRVYIESGDDIDRLAWARDLFRAAADRVPHNPLYHLNLAYAHMRLGQWVDAGHALEGALESSTSTLPAWFFYEALADCQVQQAETLVASGDLDEAANALTVVHERFLGLVSSGLMSRALMTAGDVRLRQGHYAEAAQLYGRIDRFARAVDLASLELRLALLSALRADGESAEASIEIAIEQREADGSPNAQGDLAHEAATLVSTAVDTGALADALAELDLR